MPLYIIKQQFFCTIQEDSQTLEIYYIQQQGRLLLEGLSIYTTLDVASANLHVTDPSNTRATHPSWQFTSLHILFLSLWGPIASSHTENISWTVYSAKLPPASVTDCLDCRRALLHVLWPVYVSNLMLLFLFPLLFGIAVYESASYNTQLGCLRKKKGLWVSYRHRHIHLYVEKFELLGGPLH